jgi:hypothetical protein
MDRKTLNYFEMLFSMLQKPRVINKGTGVRKEQQVLFLRDYLIYLPATVISFLDKGERSCFVPL